MAVSLSSVFSISIREGASAVAAKLKAGEEETRGTEEHSDSDAPNGTVERLSHILLMGSSSVLEPSHVPTSEAEDLPSSGRVALEGPVRSVWLGVAELEITLSAGRGDLGFLRDCPSEAALAGGET